MQFHLMIQLYIQCLGPIWTFGNHVSDWEHQAIRFQNNVPTDMYLAAHGLVCDDFSNTYLVSHF